MSDDDNHCEMCGEVTYNEEWVDYNGTAILYCDDCRDRRDERIRNRLQTECDRCGCECEGDTYNGTTILCCEDCQNRMDEKEINKLQTECDRCGCECEDTYCSELCQSLSEKDEIARCASCEMGFNLRYAPLIIKCDGKTNKIYCCVECGECDGAKVVVDCNTKSYKIENFLQEEIIASKQQQVVKTEEIKATMGNNQSKMMKEECVEEQVKMVVCAECDAEFDEKDTVLNEHYGQERNWCEECYEEKHTQCDCCEDFFFFEEMTDPMNCDHYYCEECAEREFGTCDECEEACSSDAKYCPDCEEKKAEEAYKIENFLQEKIMASKQQQDEQVKMENTRCDNAPECGCCWDSAIDEAELSKNTNVKKIEVQKENTDRSILQEEDEQVKMENTTYECGEDYECGECVVCARNRPCECGCGLKGGTCEEQTKKNEETSDSDEEHNFPICEECFCEMMKQMTGNGVGEENGYYQCPPLSPHEIQNYTVGGLNFCEKHYNKIVEEEKVEVQKEKADRSRQKQQDEQAKMSVPNCVYYYKGTAFPMCTTHYTRDKAMKDAIEVIERRVKKGISKERQGKQYKEQLDKMEEALYRHSNGGATVDGVEEAMKELNMDVNQALVMWGLNVCALLHLGVIKEDNDNGTQLTLTQERVGEAWCAMKGCGRSCMKKNDVFGLAHKNTPSHTYPMGSWVCDICWEEKGLGAIKEMLKTSFKEEDGVRCLGCSYTFGEKGFVDIGCGTIPANLIDLIKPLKKKPDYWCGACLDDLCKMSEDKALLNPDDEFEFLGRTAGADDGFEPIDELRAKGKELNKQVNDHCYWAAENELARLKGMMEYNDLFLTRDELLKVMNGYRFVVNKDARIREWKKGKEAEKVAAELVANAELFVEEKKEKPKTKKQLQAEATKSANQAVKDKKKAKDAYEKAVIECAKRQAEQERLKAEKKYRAKMAKEKAAKKAAEKI